MSVAALLSKKPSDSIITVSAETSIREASELLAKHRIGAVVVTEDKDRVVGILSERDIVRGLAARGASVMTQKVADLMTAPVETCTPSEAADDIMRRMSDGRFRHMPVTEGTKLVGVISIGDVVKNRITTLEQEANAMRDYITTG
ncbi:MAG: CBS domain-containing protein [Alphaproteobacteria bacterium]|nr:CBS domain-containing protein [Alphaproteobacteria bacterium]